VRIGIDARELCGQATGVGRYLSGLLRAWAADAEPGRHEFVLYAHGPVAAPSDIDGFAARFVPGRGGTLWEQRDLPAAIAADRLDVFLSPGYTAPLLTRVPLVVAIHDASFAAHPEWFTAREGLRRRVLTRRAAARARAVLTISAFSRNELIERLGVAADKIHVIPPGVEPLPHSGPSDETAVPMRRASVLYVGSIFNRRHVPQLIEAVAELVRAHPEVSLDVVGDNRSHPYQDIPSLIDRCGTGQMRWHRYLADPELGALYQRARAFAFLSEYEGLGLPPLEALAHGVPSVLLDTPVARESCGDAALYVRQGDIHGTARALSKLLFDESTRHRLLAAAPDTLARFSWETAAHDTLAVLEAAR
jgi:glycosyltransferase involved in cell wall biosynthesis